MRRVDKIESGRREVVRSRLEVVQELMSERIERGNGRRRREKLS
jgi:hypothetical protein